MALVLVVSACGGGSDSAPSRTTEATTTTQEQWSSTSRALVVEACIDEIEDLADSGGGKLRYLALVRTMGLQGITTRELCRCAQNELERQWTWSAMDLLGTDGTQDPAAKAIGAVSFMYATPYPAGESILEIGCREEMLD